jgi:DNA-binding transcriptional LysR family regulator
MAGEPIDLGHRLGLPALRAFAEIMHTGSATAAGRALGLSQPAISRVIAQMEDQIGFELFYRDKGRLVPTKDALSLIDEVELALASVSRVDALIRDISTHSTGEIRIIAPPSFAEGLLPGLVARFLARFPRIRISVDSRSVATTKTMLATRVVDCAFMRMPINRDDLRAETVMRSGSVCVLRDDHPLAERKSLDPVTIGDAPIITLGSGSVLGREIEQLFRDHNCRQNVVVECHTTSAACAMARSGIGIAIANEALARAYVQPPLTTRPLSPAMLHDYAFVVSSQTRMSRLLEEFRAETFSYFRSIS